MIDDDAMTVNRRRLLLAALIGGAGATVSGCSRNEETDPWAGFDERITDRTLAEAEKLFGLEFTAAERQQILGGPAETAEDGFFA